MKAHIVVDLQFGSTAKGKVCQYLTTQHRFDASVRVQSIQAGHTVIDRGHTFKMRTIPCAFVDPNCMLVLGPGCFLEEALLLHEIEMLEEAGYQIRDRLYIDYRAFYVIPEDFKSEKDLSLEQKIGSTSEGAGASLVRKLMRVKDTSVGRNPWTIDQHIKVVDTIDLLKKAEVLVEGCQGTMLSVHTSPYYPYVTSRECTAVGIASEVGISPFDIKRVHGVFRTFPIRVGGNSGDTGADELDWEEVAEYRGAEIVPERTTVTNRQRRIFDFSDSDFQQAVYLNGPTDLYLTFVDYIDAKDQDIINWSQLSVKSKLWITSLEQRHECHIGWVSTGQRPDSYIRR